MHSKAKGSTASKPFAIIKLKVFVSLGNEDMDTTKKKQ